MKKYRVTFYSDHDPSGEYGDDFSPWQTIEIEAENEAAARAAAAHSAIAEDGGVIHSIEEVP